MKSLKIKNFGPIINGYEKNNGFITFAKNTVFCGPQGVGKSTIAKLYSTFCWLEKALNRGDFNPSFLTETNRLVDYCKYQNIQNYFRQDTFLHFKSETSEMIYNNGEFNVKTFKSNDYIRPQIIYIPAERNVLSVLEETENVKRLPQTLNTLLDVFTASCRNISQNNILPVNNIHLRYDKFEKNLYIQTGNYTIKLSESSSGLQSLTPLYMVLDYLSKNLGKDSQKSQKEREEIKKRIDDLLNDDSLDTETRKLLINKASDTSNKYLLSIVEEPEQNLYPSSQRNIFNFLTAINRLPNNQLVITTHSPYIIDYMAIAIKAGTVLKKIPQSKIQDLTKIVPKDSVLYANEVCVYEITDNGSITQLDMYDGMPSDENMLNFHLNECNDMFGQLLELEEEI